MEILTPSASATPARTSEPGPAAVSAAEDWFRPCALILIEDESSQLPDIVKALADDDLPCVLIDGRGATNSDRATQLDELARYPAVHVLSQIANEGRGAAIVRGLREAAGLGYSHAAQVDANGRDDLQRVSLFLDRASQAPDAVICSHPQPDAKQASSDFATRCVARLSRLSASVRASLCELRVYPLATTLTHARCPQLARARHYDSELLMRMHGQNLPMVWLRTPRLPGSDGRSRGARMGALDIARLLVGALLSKR